MADQPWWQADEATAAWILSGACNCRHCRQCRAVLLAAKGADERPMPRPKTPDPALPNEAGKLPPRRHSDGGGA